MTQEKFTEKFLEKREIVVHQSVFNREWIQGLDEAISKGPQATRKYYERWADNLPQSLNDEDIGEVTKEIENRDTEHLTNHDRNIIEFFSDEANEPKIEEIINITGVLVNSLGLIDDINLKSYCITPNIEAASYFWLYLNLYELILDALSKSLLAYYEDQDSLNEARKHALEDLRATIEKGEHFTSGRIESELSGLDIIPNENNSIFSKERSRVMRNNIGHANVFFDDSTNELVFSDGNRVSYREFKKEFQILFQFVLEWAYRLNDNSAEVDKKITESFQAISSKMGRALIKFDRSGGDWEKVKMKLLED